MPADELPAGPVTLVRYRGGEAQAVARAVVDSLEHLRPWMPWAADPIAASEQASFVERSLVQWRAGEAFNYWLREEATGQLVGGAGLMRRIGPGRLEIGYWVRVDRTRRGYATAAAAALTQGAFDAGGVHRVEIHCDEANRSSAAVPRLLGYTLDRVVPVPIEAPGECGRRMVWAIGREGWAAVRAPCAAPTP